MGLLMILPMVPRMMPAPSSARRRSYHAPGHGRVEGVRLLAAFPGTEHEVAGLLGPNLLVAQQAVLDADRVGRQRDRQRTGVAGCGMSTKKEKRSPATGITEQRLPSATYVVPWVAGPIASLIGIRPLKFVDPA